MRKLLVLLIALSFSLNAQTKAYKGRYTNYYTNLELYNTKTLKYSDPVKKSHELILDYDNNKVFIIDSLEKTKSEFTIKTIAVNHEVYLLDCYDEVDKQTCMIEQSNDGKIHTLELTYPNGMKVRF